MKNKKMTKYELEGLGFDLDWNDARITYLAPYKQEKYNNGDDEYYFENVFDYSVEDCATCCGVGEITGPEWYSTPKHTSQAVEYCLDNEDYSYLITYLEVKVQANEIKFLKTCGFKQIGSFYNPSTRHDLVILGRHKRSK